MVSACQRTGTRGLSVLGVCLTRRPSGAQSLPLSFLKMDTENVDSNYQRIDIKSQRDRKVCGFLPNARDVIFATE